MKRISLSLFLTILLLHAVFAQDTIDAATGSAMPQQQETQRFFSVPKLSNRAYASLLTIGTGEISWQIFGHTAIRIKDDEYGWDLIYNYGAFDFNVPNFELQFARGRLMYFLWVENYDAIAGLYSEENRWIREQKLKLDSAKLQQLFELLTINAREENRYYQYEFLFNNCSTKPRDILLHIYGDNIKYHPNADDSSTFRELIDRHVKNEWWDFGIDLLLGMRVDKEAGFDRTFLPVELMELFEDATVDGQRIITGNEVILDTIPQHHKKVWLTPGLVFWIIFFIVLYLQLKRKTLYNWKIFPAVWFTLLGLIGWLLLIMWLFSDHQATKANLNILWAFPLHFPLVFFMFKEPMARWLHIYLKTYRILLVILLVGWWANPQQFHAATIPIILTGIILSSRFLPIPTTSNFKERWFG